MGILSRVLAAALCVSATACMMPPFDQSQSLAYLTLGKMEKVAKIGPVSFVKRQDLEARTFRFIPEHLASPAGGFLVAEGGSGLDVWAIGRDFSGRPAASRMGAPVDASDSKRFNYALWPLKTLAFGTMALMIENPRHPTTTSPDLYKYQCLMGPMFFTTPSVTFASATNNTPLELVGDLSLGGLPVIVGASFAPDTVPGFERYHVLASYGGSWYEISYQISGSSPEATFSYDINSIDRTLGAAIVPSTTALPSLPAAVFSGFYFYDRGSSTSYLSVPSSGSWYTTYRWRELPAGSGNLVTDVLPFTARITAVLSNGDLLLQHSDETDIRNSDGRLKYTILTGSLAFAYETYATGAPAAVFTNLYWGEGSNNDDKTPAYLEVYRKSTDSLRELAQ
jgi:hypothetical protein